MPSQPPFLWRTRDFCRGNTQNSRSCSPPVMMASAWSNRKIFPPRSMPLSDRLVLLWRTLVIFFLIAPFENVFFWGGLNNFPRLWQLSSLTVSTISTSRSRLGWEANVPALLSHAHLWERPGSRINTWAFACLPTRGERAILRCIVPSHLSTVIIRVRLSSRRRCR